MVAGLAPREASDRLNVFQLHFDDLWRKLETFSGGEELFGLEVTEYPELQRIRRELNLLQKLYQLYNGVLDRVRSYHDIAWLDIDVDNINAELVDFQNKYARRRRRLIDRVWRIFTNRHLQVPVTRPLPTSWL